MRTIIAALSFFLLVGCASNQNHGNATNTPKSLSVIGYEYIQAGRYAEAEQVLTKSIQAGINPRDDWHNLGFALERRSRTDPAQQKDLLDKAIRCYTMGARYGEPLSQQALINLKQPVPAMDLAASAQSQESAKDNSNAGAVFLLGILGAGMAGWAEGRSSVSPTSQQLFNDRSISCTTTTGFGSSTTNCR